MTTHFNGKEVKEMYVNGRSVGEAYSYGHLVFSKNADGWRQGPSVNLVINSINNTSISGTLQLLRFDYYQSGAITDRYYQVGSKNLTDTAHGVVEFSFGPNVAVDYGSLGASCEYYTPASGNITMSADELRRLFRIRGVNQVIDLGSSPSGASYYVEPVWDMAPTMNGTDTVVCAAGWSVCYNRTSRISVASSLSTNVSALNLPSSTGTFPIFMVAQSASETSAVSLTCASSAHQLYDRQCLRTVGFITVNNSVITNIIPVSDAQYTAGYPINKSISGTVLTTGEGWATDTDGIKVLVPAASYNFADMVAAAADRTTDWATVPNSYVKSEVKDWSSTSSGSAMVDTNPINQYGPCNIKITANGYNPSYVAPSGYTKRYILTAWYTLLSNTSNRIEAASITEDNASTGTKTVVSPSIQIPSGDALYTLRVNMYVGGMPSTNTTTWYSEVSADYQQNIEGTTQTRLVYAKVTRSSTSSGKSCEITTTAGDSTAFTSYVYLGTITVTRNSSTGTIS